MFQLSKMTFRQQWGWAPLAGMLCLPLLVPIAAASVDSSFPQPPQIFAEPPVPSQNSASPDQISTQSDERKLSYDSASGKLDVLELKDVDIAEVLKLISRRANLNIVVNGNVKGKVTLFLKDVEVKSALQMILVANDLAYEENDGILQVMTAQEYERKFGLKFGICLETKLINLKEIRASNAAKLLSEMKGPDGSILSDDVSNTLLLKDTAEKIAQMEEYLRNIDITTYTRSFAMNNMSAQEAAKKVKEVLSPGLGKVWFDEGTNKLFVRDTFQQLKSVQEFLAAIDEPRRTIIVDLSYAKAEQVAKSVNNELTKDVGYVDHDQRTNQVIVSDIPSKVDHIETMIKALDKQEEEVLIEAKIVQVTLQDEYKMGVDWQAVIPKLHDMQLAGDFGGLASTLGSDVSKKGQVRVGTLAPDQDNYEAVVDALATMGKTKVLSNPRIVVLNNEQAKILVGTNQPYVTSTTTTTSSGPVTNAETVNFIEVGVKLYVTPVIHNDGYITMKIKPEVSSAPTSLPTGSKNSIPIVDTSEVETTVRVKDGATIVMGGLIKDEQGLDEKKVPLLGSIPVLGMAFKNTSKTKAKTEIVIFLTPRIISGDKQPDFANQEEIPQRIVKDLVPYGSF